MNQIHQEQSHPICQSCAMPLQTAADFGTEKNGARSRDYCGYCFKNGAFVVPSMTMDQMRDFCADKMVELGALPRDQALVWMQNALPKLKRWAGRSA